MGGGLGRVTLPVRTTDGPPDRDHPAAPPRGLQPGPRPPGRERRPARRHSRRAHLSRRGRRSSVRSLPLANLRDPPTQPGPPLSMPAGASETVRTPPPGPTVTAPPSPPERAATPVVPGPQLPVAGTLPSLTTDKNSATLKTPTGQSSQAGEDKTKAMADSSATPSAPSVTPPGVAADSLPRAAHPGQVPATANRADPPATPPTSSVPCPPPRPTVDHHTGHTLRPFSLPPRPRSLPPPSADTKLGIPLLKTGGRFHLALVTTAPASDGSTPAMASPSSFQPASCTHESPSPMCVDPPPALPLPSPFLLTGQPITSVAVPSTSANASANVAGESDVTDMDTTPPSDVFTFTAAPSGLYKWSRRRPRARSPPCCSNRSHRHPRAYCRVENSPDGVVYSIGPPGSKYLRLAPCYVGGPKTGRRPTSGTCGGGKAKSSVAPAAAGGHQAPVSSAGTQAPANSTSAKPVEDTEPMDTTPAP